MNDWKCNRNLNEKQKCPGKESEIENALLEWFFKKRARNIPISGLLLKQKAEDLARQFKIIVLKLQFVQMESKKQNLFKKTS